MNYNNLLLFISKNFIVFELYQNLEHRVTNITAKYMCDSEVILFTNTRTIASPIFNGLKSAITRIHPTFTVNIDVNVGRLVDIVVPAPRNIVLYADGIKMDEISESLMDNPYWNARARLLVIAESSKDVKPWLESLWNKTRAVNVVVISLEEPYSYKTWFPYAEGECDSVRTIASLRFRNLFPEKIGKNLHGCQIRAYCSQVLPFVLNREKGVEPEIFQTILKKLNLTSVFMNSSNEAYNYINHRGEVTGPGKQLRQHEIEVMFANLLRGYLNWKYFDLITSHTEDSLSWFVPSPKPLSRAVGLYFAFSESLWIAVISVAVATFLLCIIFSYFDEKFDSFLFTWCLTLNLNTPAAKLFSLRVLIILAYVYSLHITTAYQASLITFLSTIQRENPIDNIEEAADRSDLKVYLLNAYKYVIVNISQHEVWDKLLAPSRPYYFQRLPIEDLKRTDAIELAPKLTLQYSLQNASYFDEFGQPLMTVLPIPNFLTAVNFFMSPGHPLRAKFNWYTYLLVEGGLPKYWSNEFMNRLFKVVSPNLKRPFGVNNLIGAFFVLFFLLFLSGVIFIMELIWNTAKLSQRKI